MSGFTGAGYPKEVPTALAKRVTRRARAGRGVPDRAVDRCLHRSGRRRRPRRGPRHLPPAALQLRPDAPGADQLRRRRLRRRAPEPLGAAHVVRLLRPARRGGRRGDRGSAGRAAGAEQLDRQQQDVARAGRQGDPRGQPLAAARVRGLPRRLLQGAPPAATGCRSRSRPHRPDRRALPAGRPGQGRRGGRDPRTGPQQRLHRHPTPSPRRSRRTWSTSCATRSRPAGCRRSCCPSSPASATSPTRCSPASTAASSPSLVAFTEVIQDGMLDLLDSGTLRFASATSFGLSSAGRRAVHENIDRYKGRILLRSEEISNHPELVRRLGVHRDERHDRGRHLRQRELHPRHGQRRDERHRRQRRLRPQRLPQLLHLALDGQERRDLARSCRWSATSTTPSTTCTCWSPSRGWPTCAGCRRGARRKVIDQLRPPRLPRPAAPTTSTARSPRGPPPPHPAPAGRGAELAPAVPGHRPHVTRERSRSPVVRPCSAPPHPARPPPPRRM